MADYAGIPLIVAGVIKGLTEARRGLKTGLPCLMAVVC